MPNRAQTAVFNEAKKAVLEAAESPSIPVEASAADAVASQMVHRVNPVLEHFTNNENWYQSRIAWGLIVGLISTAARPITGVAVSDADIEMYAHALSASGQLVGFGLIIWGRFFAKKPLGQK